MMKQFMLVILSGLWIAIFILPVEASEWLFYGSARMATFSEDNENGTSSDRDTTWGLQSNSRIGASVKVNDTLSGSFEYGTGVNLRKLYGEWDFGAGKLLVGQTYTPISDVNYSNQVFDADSNMENSGQPDIGRKPMIRLSFGGFNLAFVKPETGNEPDPISGDTDVTLPKIEASYALKMNAYSFTIFGGYQTYEAESVDIDSYIAGIGAACSLGAFYAGADLYFAQNGYAYGLKGLGDASLEYDPSGDTIIDNDSLGYLVVIGYKINESFTIEAGYGAVSHELDKDGAQKDETSTLYVNTKITLAPGVYVVPEFGFIDYKENAAGTDQGDKTYMGAKWQIDF